MAFGKNFLKSYWQYIVLAGLVLVTYCSFANNAFVSDDLTTFVKNERLQTYTGLSFLEKINSQNFIFHLSYKFFGLNPLPLHLFSVALHLVNTFLFYIFAKKLFDSKISFGSALLFAVHPLNSESVLWASAVNYLVNFMFIFVTLLLYLKAKNPLYLFASCAVYVVNLVFTTNVWALLTPFVLLGVVFLANKKFAIKKDALRLSLFFLISLVAFFVLFQRPFSARADYISQISESSDPRLFKFTLPYSIGSAAKLLVYPQNLTLYHEGEFIIPNIVTTSRVITGAVILLMVYFFLKQRELFFIGALIFVSILPTMSPVRIANFFAERYVYFGTAFFCILLAKLLLYMAKKFKTAELYFIFLFIFVLLYSTRAFIRGAEWKDSITFWEATVRESPYSAGASNNLGIEYVKASRFNEALEQFQNAIKINPNVPDAQYNVGKILLVGGRYDLAEPYLLNALKLSPNEPKIIDAVNTLNARKQGM